jgi:aminopeptidase
MAAAVASQALRHRLAELAVSVGIEVLPGDKVAVAGAPEQLDTIREVVEAAYRAGAHYVEPFLFDHHAKRSRLEHAPQDTLDFVPRSWTAHFEQMIEERWSNVSVYAPPSSELFDGVDPRRLAIDRMPLTRDVLRMIASGRVPWTLVAAPTTAWARDVFGEPDVDRLWTAVGHATRLDTADPAAEWQARLETLARRADALNERRFESLHFSGPGTDLRVGLLGPFLAARWRTDAGRAYAPNLPTEEVFATPDHHRVEGTVRTTKPVFLATGVLVEGLRLRFAGGECVEVEATRNADAVRREMEHDRGARRLGEVALVEASGPINDTGLVFKHTLLDENAASHIAWGNAYPVGIDLPDDPAEREAMGYNESAVHTDVMIGSEEVSVAGLTAAGEGVDVVRDGTWVL